MKTFLIIVGVAVGVVALVYVLWWLISRSGKRQMAFLRSRPLIREAGALSQGLVQIEGRVEIDRPLRAPISGLPCLAWRIYVNVIEDVDAENPSGHMVTVRRPSCLAPFHVSLQGDRVCVAGDPHWSMPESTLTGSQTARMTGQTEEFPEHLRALLISCISRGTPFVQPDERLIVDEFIIKPDVTVFVVGEARKSGPDPAEPRRAATSWHVNDQKKVVPVEYKLPPRFPLLIEMTGDAEPSPGPAAWTIGPGKNRPLLVVEGTKAKLLDDMAHYKKSLHVDFPVD